MISGATVIFTPLDAQTPDQEQLSAVSAEAEQVEATLSQALADPECHRSEQLAARLHEVGEMLSHLAELHIRKGENGKAEVLCLRAIQIFGGALSADHPLLALARDNLAGLYKARRQYALAESLQRTALADLKRYYGQPHADIAITMCNLADTCMMTGRSEDARHLLREGTEMFRRLFGNDDPKVRDLIAHFENTLNRYSQSLTPAV
jgi:tetratricopeptide (TPR) repeat protein